MIQILIVDDHEVVRQGLRALLDGHPGWSICGEAATGIEAVAKAAELRPDLILLDVGLPEMNGLEAARRIRQIVPTAKILILTVHDVEQLAQDFVEAGARGYMLKGDAGRLLLDAVNALVHDRTFFTPSLHLTTDTAKKYGAQRAKPAIAPLTTREREVLQLIAEGKANKEIGVILGMSTKTAETHRARLMTKLGLHTVADLVRYAVRNQIVQP